MPASLPFGPQLIGQTEKTLNALLVRELTATKLTEPLWVTLSFAVMSGAPVERERFAQRLADAIKIDEAQANERVARLIDAGLLGSSEPELVSVTEAGAELHARIRTRVAEITERLWGDLPDEELSVAGRVLGTVLERARAEF
jgi:DNA-binding MarR family transcriptional regulator